MFYYVGDHVRVYHGNKATLTKRFVSRGKLCLAGTTDYWINNEMGLPYLVVTGGWYSNKSRGLRKNGEVAITPTPDIADADWEKLEPESAYVKKCRMTWAALIKDAYEVDPLKCPKCGGTMKIISFIEDDATIQKILKNCGKWKDAIPRPPLQIVSETASVAEDVTLDYSFSSRTVFKVSFQK